MRKVLYILGQFSDEDVEWLIANGQRQNVGAGQTLIQRGVPLDSMFIVLEGLLGVYTTDPRPIAELGAGEVVGEISLVDNRPPLATVKAIQPTTVFSIPDTQLYNKMETDFEFASRFYKAIATFLAYRLRDTTSQLGYGKEGRLDSNDSDELDENVLDNVYLAGTRFDRILKRMME